MALPRRVWLGRERRIGMDRAFSMFQRSAWRSSTGVGFVRHRAPPVDDDPAFGRCHCKFRRCGKDAGNGNGRVKGYPPLLALVGCSSPAQCERNLKHHCLGSFSAGPPERARHHKANSKRCNSSSSRTVSACAQRTIAKALARKIFSKQQSGALPVARSARRDRHRSQ